MEEEIIKKITEHDLLIKEIPVLQEAVHKQDITNEKILNKMDSLGNSINSVNIRLDKMDKNFEAEKEKTQISWTSSIKNGIVKVFEYGVIALLLYGVTLASK